ncbi:MAG: hypothetical protein IJZ06_06005 [Bacteroidales bacterium]|nr:hypothetical protein [Bacteroidales bacterium]
MSKTFEANAEKALTLASSLKKHFNEVENLGISREVLNKLESNAKKAIEMNREVDALRETVSEKLHKANDKLSEVKDLAMDYRKIVKTNFPQEKWERYGVMDKR